MVNNKYLTGFFYLIKFRFHLFINSIILETSYMLFIHKPSCLHPREAFRPRNASCPPEGIALFQRNFVVQRTLFNL
jgi:hypothetical protein